MSVERGNSAFVSDNINDPEDQLNEQEMIPTENVPAPSNENSALEGMDFQSNTSIPTSENQLLIKTQAA